MALSNENGGPFPNPNTLLEGVTPLCDTVTFDPQVESDKVLASGRTCGRYVLEQLLGKGGFGEVWKGLDPSLDRSVAIKRLRPDHMVDSSAATAFLEEGRKLAVLTHSGIVSVYDAGVSDGRPYIVSELVYGGSLAGYMNRESFDIPEACRIVRKLAEALHYVHVRGIVHRDIKPQNILMEDGSPKLADFGLAISEAEQLGEQPAVVGTYTYMSPEQIRGDSHLVDGRSDLYSLGVVFYQLLTGRTPFLANSQDQLREQILHREPRPLRLIKSEIPAELEAICLKCLRKSISERYTTALDLVGDLQKYEESRNRRPQSRRRTVLWIAFLFAGLVAGAGYAVVNLPEGETSKLPAPPAPAPQLEPKKPNPVQNLLGNLALHAITEYTVDPQGKYLNVTTFNRSLVSLGVADDEDLEWEVSFSQPQWTGDLGVFFGYRPLGDGLHTQYHALYLFKAGQDYYLRSSIFRFRMETPGGVHTNYMGPQWKIDNFQHPKNTIGIRLAKGKLAHIEFNGQDLDDRLLAKIQKELNPNEADCRGQFGLLNMESAGRFLAPMINEEEILYQVSP